MNTKWDFEEKSREGLVGVDFIVLTGGESVRKAKHEEPKQISPAGLSGVSKRFAGSFPTVVVLAVAEDGDQHI